jgi:RNA polymerase-binding transcription factor DksA
MKMSDYSDIEKLLRKRLAVLQEKVEEIDDELELPGDDDFEEMASEAQGDQVLEGVGLVANEEIQDIQLALKRIEEGNYGECGRCGNLIATRRLEVIPHASFCVKCEELLEKQKK